MREWYGGKYNVKNVIKNIFTKEFLIKKIAIITMILLIVKTILFITIAISKSGYEFAWYDIEWKLLPAHISMLALIVIPCYLFKNRLRYLKSINIIYTVFLILSLWYYRGAGEYFGIRHILFSEMFNPVNKPMFNPSVLDILFTIDIIGIICLKLNNPEYKRNIKIFIFGIIAAIGINGATFYLYDVKKIDKKIKFMETTYFVKSEMQNMWPIGYQLYDGIKSIKNYNIDPNLEQINEIDQWFVKNNENLVKDKYFGSQKGKNVIYVQLESLEGFVIGRKIFGQEITPNLNKIINKSMYFNNIYEQNNRGNSIDCDFMVNTSVLPLGDMITLLNSPYSKYPSMARILEKNGYNAISNHAEEPGDFNWAEAHANALGFKKMISLKDYVFDEKVGFGLSDESFFRQFEEKLKDFEKPYFTMIPTLSNHGPFNLQEKYRELKLPKELDKTKIGGYFQSVYYMDKQLGKFIDNLEKSGEMKDTIVVIYGDHSGVHKYYNKELQNITIEKDDSWWKQYDKKIPLIIYAEGIEKKEIETIGGHIDIMPTVLSLIGVEPEVPLMGRNLLNTKINGTVIKGNKIIGTVSKEEEEHLKEAYKIGSHIIKNNYYEYKNKVED